jgi:predicted DCC family thiol-disulfide oxidoreductase YuxK
MQSAVSILIYDGDCGICQKAVRFLQKRAKDRLQYAPFQEVADRYPQIPREEFCKAVQLVHADGSFVSAAEAMFEALSFCGWQWKGFLWSYKYIPGFAAVSGWVYHLVARHRSGACVVKLKGEK